jgi:hypothetical protein
VNLPPSFRKLASLSPKLNFTIGAQCVQILVDLFAALADAAQRKGRRIEQARIHRR